MVRNKSTLIQTRQFRRYNTTDSFIAIPKNFCTRWQVEPTQAMIYKIIADADKLEYSCYTGSKNDLATITFTNVSTVFRALKRLESRGFIAKVSLNINGKTINGYKNLGLDCNLPVHVGKPFEPNEKLLMNLFKRSDIIKQWCAEIQGKLK